MASTLTNKERAHLKARAHALDPFVQTGNAGITDAVVKEVDRALTAHELLKVRIGTDDREKRVALGDDLCARTHAAAVHRVGKVLILWRARPLEDGDAAAPTPKRSTAAPKRAAGTPKGETETPKRATATAKRGGRPRKRSTAVRKRSARKRSAR
ncbi:MAG: YhbY family RNA-binding protein [Vicinamibacteraceae bacterium]